MTEKFDIADIQSKFNKIVKYSQHLNGEVNTDDLFKDWRINKSVFIDSWDGKLIQELGEITFHLSEEQRAKAVSNVIDQIDYLYRESGIGYPDFRFDDLVSFILENQDNFFENVVKENWKNGDGIEVPKGMKILRAFKYFCNDKNLLNDVQSVASMAIQNDKITGILCMSVHPFDFLSVSENAHNWRSCHALDGEYRAGNLNYMADDCTVICYLKSDHKSQLPRFPEDIKWNSKKWRMLLFFNTDYSFMMAGRQYPFFENSLLLPIRDEVNRMFETKFSGWFDYYRTMDTAKSFLEDEDSSHVYEFPYRDKYLCVENRLLSLKKFVQNGEGALQFNDLLESSSYTEPYYSFQLQRSWSGNYYNSPAIKRNGITKIKVGKKCKCLECGKEDITMSEAFLCNHCMIDENQALDGDVFGQCEMCGCTYVLEEGGYILNQFSNNINVCPDCLDQATRCEKCGELYDSSAIDEMGLCPICSQRYFQKENNKPLTIDTIQFVDFKDIADNNIILHWDVSNQDDFSAFSEVFYTPHNEVS